MCICMCAMCVCVCQCLSEYVAAAKPQKGVHYEPENRLPLVICAVSLYGRWVKCAWNMINKIYMHFGVAEI